MRFLPEAGRPVQNQAHDLETLYDKKEKLEKELAALINHIEDSEQTADAWIEKDWTKGEIQEAKLKANKHNQLTNRA